MNELIRRLVAGTGNEWAMAGKTVDTVLQFQIKEDSANDVQNFVARPPHAKTAVDKTSRNSNSGRQFDGGAMAAGSRSTTGGLRPAEMRAVTRETTGHARTQVGAEAAGAVAGATPDCGRFA